MSGSIVSICNRALGKMGKSIMISSLDQPGAPAAQCKLNYDPIRQQLLRMAPWGFTRKTVTLSLLGQLLTVPPSSPFPFLEKYLYPNDCLKFRYILPPPYPISTTTVAPDVSTQQAWLFPWCSPRRDWRYVVGFDDTEVPARKVLLSNVPQALGVYTADVTDPSMFDPLFEQALVAALAATLVIPLSGNAGLVESFVKIANDSLLVARAADGNEAIPKTDHTVDWIATRGVGGYTSGLGAGPGQSIYNGWGDWYSSYDGGSWSM